MLSRIPTLARFSSSPSSSSIRISHSSRILPRRNRSSLSTKAQLIEVDLQTSSSSADDGGSAAEVELLGIKKLEEVLHNIIVRRSAPDWLPFVPGATYWVPHKPSANSIVELVGKLTNPLSEEERLSLTTVRGWPSSSFFIEGGVSSNAVAAEVVEVEVHVRNSPEEASQSKDEA
ncbi:hypothetical protein Ancab_027810 [Ancistrocladus abbreviatus]